ncbi:MAG: hypothetical protein AB7N76_06125 [Planctomycetota bacterium]
MSAHDDALEAWLQEQGAASAADLAAYRAAEGVLRGASPLRREFCPSREDLVAPQRVLGQTLSAARERHLAACPLCRDDLADHAALTALAPSGGALLLARLSLALEAGRDLLRLVESSLSPAAPVALAPARGGEAAAAGLAQRAAWGAGELRFEWAPVRGAVDLAVAASAEGPRPFRVDLFPPDGGGLIESRSSDDEGVARLSGLAPGEYLLRVCGPHEGGPVLEVELELGSPGPGSA